MPKPTPTFHDCFSSFRITSQALEQYEVTLKDMRQIGQYWSQQSTNVVSYSWDALPDQVSGVTQAASSVLWSSGRKLEVDGMRDWLWKCWSISGYLGPVASAGLACLLLEMKTMVGYYTPHSMKLKGGILVSPCLSVCPSVCPSVDRIVSSLYLLQYSPDPFHIYTFYQATSEGVWIFVKFFKFVILTLFCFDLGSNMDWSIVWVIMGRWVGGWVYSERSCSSFQWCHLMNKDV